MPSSRSFRRVVLVWLLRAWALRRCWCVIFAAVFSSNRSDAAWPLAHQDRINAAIAVWSWHTVNSRFFPPLLTHLSQEQVTDRRQDQVPFQSQVTPALVLIQAELTLVVFKTTLYPPPRKRHQQHGADRCLRRRVAHEEFDLIRIEHVAGDDQVQPRPRQAVCVFDRDEGMLTLPNHRSFRPVLDAPALPGLITQGGLVQQLLDTACWSAATGQTWNGTAP